MKSLARIFALVIRYFYLIKTSFPRILELMYWPTFQMILWGLIAKYLTYSNDTVLDWWRFDRWSIVMGCII